MSKKTTPHEQAFLEDFDGAKIVNECWGTKASALEVLLEMRRFCWNNNTFLLTKSQVNTITCGRDITPLIDVGMIWLDGAEYQVRFAQERLKRSRKQADVMLNNRQNISQTSGRTSGDRPIGPEAHRPQRPRGHLKDSELSSKDSGAKARKEKAASPWFGEIPNGEVIGELQKTFRELRHADYAFGPRDGKACKELAKLSKGNCSALYSRWALALKREGFPKVRTLPELLTNWNHFAKPEPKPAPVVLNFAEQQRITDERLRAEYVEKHGEEAAKAFEAAFKASVANG